MKCSVLIFLGVFSISAVRALPRADEKNLAFTRRVFTYRYDGSLQHEGGAIVVTGDDFVNANITLSKNGSEEFAVSKPNAADGVITLTVSGAGALSAATLLKEVVILEIIGTRGSDTASAYIFVFLPNARSPFFKFLSKVFLGSYSTINDDQAVVTINENIVIDGNFDNVILNLTEDYLSNFKPSIGNDGKVTLDVVESLAAEALANNEILLTLTATRGQGSPVIDDAEVILKLPNTQEATPLHFLDTLYYFDYSEEDGTGKLTARTGIKIRADDLGAVVVTVTPAETFQVVLEASSGTVTLSLTEGISLTDANNKAEITITNGHDTATVNAFVKLPNGQSKTPLHFRSNVITGKYTAEQGLTINDEFAIIAEDLNNIELGLDQATGEIFQAPNLDTRTGEIALALKNPSQWTPTGNQFTVKITARTGEEIATSDVIIQLPDTQKTELLHFATNIYTAEYIDNSIILDQEAIIRLESFVTGTDVSTNDDDIKADVDENGVVTLSLAEGVDALTPTADDKNKLTVTVTATSSGFSVEADVVVKFNSNPDFPIFKKNVFVKTLSSENLIKGDDEIKIDPSDDDDITPVKVQVDEVRKNYLAAEIDSDGIITLKIIQGGEIPENVLINSQFTVELSAIAGDAESTLLGSTVVVVTLPKLPNTVALHFSSNFYTADYSEDPNKGTVTVDNFALLGGMGATLELDPVSAEYLEPTLTNDVVALEVKNDKIPEGYLKDKNHINVQLIATLNEQTVTADIAVKIPKEKETIPLHFSDNFYSTSLTTEGNVDIADMVLKGQDLSQTTVRLDGDHATFFEAHLEAEATPQLGGVVKITYGGGDLANQNEIALKLIAANEELGQSVTSDLVVKIPKDPVKIPLHFSSNVYSARYSEAGELTTVDGPIKIIADTLPAYQVEVDEPNRGYFKLTPNPNDEFTFALAIDALPEDLVSQNNHVIVKVTATAAGHTNVTSDVVVTLQKTVHDKPHFKRKVFVAEHTVNKEEVTVTLTVDNSIIEGHEPHRLKLEDDKNLFDATVSEAGVVDLKWAAGKDALKDEKDRIVEVKLTATDEAANKEQVTLYVVLEPKSGAFDHSGVAAVTLMMTVVWALFA